jgi:hypothetical protein
MSSTRSDPPPTSGNAPNTSGSEAPPLKQMRMMHAAAMNDAPGPPQWRAAGSSHLPPHETRPSSHPPSPAVAAIRPPPIEASSYADQLAVDDAALVMAVLASLKELVADQECSFIARGVCHLCSADAERKLVPVVNFCPDFSPTHSLCREHLRSMHRVRLVDIFAGKNQPTVSKRALRCSVCSLSCPCSKCQFRRDAEILRYKQWLAGVGEQGGGGFTLAPAADGEAGGDVHAHGDEAFAMGPRTRASRQQTPPLPTGYDDPGDARRRQHGSRDHGSDDRQYAHRANDKRDASDRPPIYYGGEEKAVSDVGEGAYPFEETVGSMDGVPPSAMRADEKRGPVSSARFPKRAAKESVAYALDAPNAAYAPLTGHHHHPYHHSGLLGGNAALEPDLPSPSAASVLNCPDSEKSLVDLLSSLNQRVTPAVRYFTDAEEPRFREMMEDEYPRAPHGDDMVAGSRDNIYESSVHRQKRKRESGYSGRSSHDRSSTIASDDEDDAPLSRHDSAASYRQKAPTPLASTADRKVKQSVVGKPPSPRGRPSGKAKSTTAVPQSDPKGSSYRKRDPSPSAPPTPAGAPQRKRKSEAPPSVTTERTAPRGASQRGHSHRSSATGNHGPDTQKRKQHSHRASADADEEIKQSPNQEEEQEMNGDDDDEDSELDANLDYCEVCLAAGDLVCCDVCPRSFHLKCLKMTEADLPEGDWQCAECRKPSYFGAFGAAVEKKTTVPAKCLQIIQCLKSHPFAKPFLQPVEDVPHYTNIVKQPMDLSTIENKLLENKYMVNSKGSMQAATSGGKILHLGLFADDVRLVWANCKLFNDDGSGITRAADQLSEGFEKLYQDVLEFVEQSATTKPAASSVTREEKRPSTHAATVPSSKARDPVSNVSSAQINAVKGSEPKSSLPPSNSPPVSQPANPPEILS